MDCARDQLTRKLGRLDLFSLLQFSLCDVNVTLAIIVVIRLTYLRPIKLS